jgi:serine/threonine protein kinase
VMEFIDGSPLTGCRFPLAIAESLRVARGVAEGLRFMHEASVIHLGTVRK